MVTQQLHVRNATGFWQRLRGLMFTSRLPQGQALFIARCTSVHTCFMRYPIDVVFLDEGGVVRGLRQNLAPWRAAAGPPGTRDTLELAAQGIARLGIRVGDRMDLHALRAAA